MFSSAKQYLSMTRMLICKRDLFLGYMPAGWRHLPVGCVDCMANSWFKQQDAALSACFFLLDVKLSLIKLLRML